MRRALVRSRAKLSYAQVQAAVDGMRHVLESVAMDGLVVIGEGEKDEAPMLYNGEQIGDGTPPAVDIAVDPIDGTTLTSKGRGNAIAVIALAERGSMFDPGPCVYMDKIAVGPEAKGSIDIDATPAENLRSVAKALGKEADRVMHVLASGQAQPAALSERLQNDFPKLVHSIMSPDAYFRSLDAHPEAWREGAQLWVIDPLGRIVLHQAPDAPGKRLLDDLKHLLKVSKVG